MNTILTEPNTDIIIIDDLPPETIAMLQALYSRSPKSVKEHLMRITTEGVEKFMGTFYVGYGHKSIGDCGTTTIFVEHASMLVAKAIQDLRLYNGQEASTRYMAMDTQPVLNPLGTDEGRKIQETWMQLYKDLYQDLIPYLSRIFPIKAGEDEKVHTKAIKAKAFDIARGFLPAGVTTFASWHTNLRQAWDHLHLMIHHPLQEVVDVGLKILDALKTKYPSSFGYKTYPEQEAYLSEVAEMTTYYDSPSLHYNATHTLDLSKIMRFRSLLINRPVKTELPRRLEACGQIIYQFPMDFAAFRDLQRQRSAIQEMPLLTTNLGFEQWYLKQLPESSRRYVEAVILEQERRIKELLCSPETRQYYVAMGYTCACEITCGLPSAVYIAELRSGQTVHPTLRKRAQYIGEKIKDFIPYITLHVDWRDDEWSVKRGTQDIVKK